ncbi:MAG TPA: hypothetical protein VND93_08200 [Myxococcales bacterium]|nr:hypothetical protein [Myxococcales bacterium]
MKPTEDRFREVFNAVEPYIERRYGVPVIISDVTNPFTGDLDGAEIRIDHDLSLEEATFILVHLFGHTVQWNLSPQSRDIGARSQANPTPQQMEELHQYEREACRYSLQLFHDAGVKDLDQWLSDFAACDFAYLKHFYATREKRPFLSFWKDDQPLLEPLAIPGFRPERWVSRWQGTVV